MESDTNDNAPLGIEVEVIECRDAPGEWLVEAINFGSEGEIYRAIFTGPEAKERALEYAAIRYGHNGIIMSSVQPPPPPKPDLRLV